jgi:hypothetical protein
MTGRNVLAPADGQIRGQLVGPPHRHKRVHPRGLGLRGRPLPRRRPADDRRARPLLEVLLDVDVEGRDAGNPLLHPLLQLGGVRAPEVRHLRVSQMGRRRWLGRWTGASARYYRPRYREFNRRAHLLFMTCVILGK